MRGTIMAKRASMNRATELRCDGTAVGPFADHRFKCIQFHRAFPAGTRNIGVWILACALGVSFVGRANADGVFINERWPIKDPNGTVLLSPPHVEPTNECSKSVFVDSFVPKATITVFLNGATAIGGPLVTVFGFADVPLTQQL